MKAVSRRDFFRRVADRVVRWCSRAEFGGATIAFLWPNLKGGFGSRDRRRATSTTSSAEIADTGAPVYNGTGRFYVVPYDGHADGRCRLRGRTASPPRGSCRSTSGACTSGAASRSAASSKWFECPCHGSKYNEAGEYQLGPAPRGHGPVQDHGGRQRQRARRHVRGRPRAAARHRHDRPAPAGRVLRGGGLRRKSGRHAGSHEHRRHPPPRPRRGVRAHGRARAVPPRSVEGAGPGHPARDATGPLRRRARDPAAAEAPGVGRRPGGVLRDLDPVHLAARALDEPEAGGGADDRRDRARVALGPAVLRGEPARRRLRPLPRAGAARRRDPGGRGLRLSARTSRTSARGTSGTPRTTRSPRSTTSTR